MNKKKLLKPNSESEMSNIPKWTREELRQMDQRKRKLMTMHKALHPRDDIRGAYDKFPDFFRMGS